MAERQWEAPIATHILSWIVLIPLLYFAVHGALFWQHAQGNSAMGAAFGDLAVSDVDSTLSRAQNVGIFLITVALAMTKYEAVVKAAMRYQVFIWLAFIAILSTAWSEMPAKSIYMATFLTGNAIFAFYLSERFHPQDWMRMLRFVGCFAIFGSILVCLLLPQYGIDHKQSQSNWQGIWTHKNGCAVVTSYLLAPALFIKSWTLRQKLLNGFYIMAAIGLIIMSQSRTGWVLAICMLFTKGALELVSRFSNRERGTIAMAVFTFGFIGIVALSFLLPVLLESIGKDPTMTGRTQIWALVMLAIIKRPILGYGYKAFWNGFDGPGAYISYAMMNLVAHSQNGFLDTWVETGIGGLLLTIYPFASATRAAANRILARPSDYDKFCICVVMITLVSNLDERSANYINFIEWIMFMVACIGLRNSVSAAASNKVVAVNQSAMAA